MACAPAAAADREGAVREVARAYERIKIQQPLLLHHQCSAQLAHGLLGDALRALNVALSLINQQPTSGGGVKAEPHHRHQLSPHIGGSPASGDDSEAAAVARRGKRRRSSSASAAPSVMETAGMRSKSSSSPSWVHVTPMPYEDGFQWRKYGEKKINGTSYTRSYFRCTFKDETGCPATKHVQQTADNATSSGHHQQQQPMPMFQVTYSNHHTCTTTSTTSPPPQNGHAAAAAAVVKQEEPPVLEIPRPAIPFDQPPLRLQEPALIPIGMQQQFCGTTTTVTRDESSHGGGSGAPSTASSSSISGESSDEYSGDMAARMAAVEAASAGDDAFYDLELLRLLCDSFKDY